MGREDEVRLIAYNIWEEEGCPDGKDCEHWFKAETIWEQRQKPKNVVKVFRKSNARITKDRSVS